MRRLGTPQNDDILLRALTLIVARQARPSSGGRDRQSPSVQPGGVRGAPQARQVADRFDVIQKLRHAIEQQLRRAPCPDESFVPGEVEPEAQHMPTGLNPSLRVAGQIRSGQSPSCRRQDAGRDPPRDRIQLAHGRQLDPAGRLAGTQQHGTKADHTGAAFFRAYLARRWSPSADDCEPSHG
jgi:hypothetical protein